MSDLLEERLAAASSFLLQSPPGEVNDVFTDLRSIVQDDQALERHILPALKQYNTEQYAVATLSGSTEGQHANLSGQKVIVTSDSRLSDSSLHPDDGRERHVDYRRGISFAFNHMNSTASDPQSLTSSEPYDAETLSIVHGIDPLFQKHVENHYHDGICAIYPLNDARYPQSPDFEPRSDAETEETQQPVQEAETDQGTTLAEGLPENPQESAQVAQETAEAAEQALGEEGGGETVETTTERSPMDLGTPVAQQPELEAEPDAEEAGSGSGMMDEVKTEDPLQSSEGGAAVEETQPQEQEKKTVERPPKTSRLFGLYLVGNKYNPNNYWTGRWRSKYVVDHEAGKIDGTALINIHYYEQGNVQLSTTLHSATQLSPSPSPEQIVAALKSSEQTFSTSLSSTYSELSEDTFKGLRRALPKTRSKIDWNKAGGYRLGAELGGASAAP